MQQNGSEYILAIDPGASGGYVYKIGSNILSGRVDELQAGDKRLHVKPGTIIVIEKVPPFVGKFIPSSSSFKLGYSYGWLVGKFSDYKTHLITPQVWQKELGIGTKGEQTTTQWKNRLKDEAIKLFPQAPKITLATADAYLILHYALKNNL